MMDPNAVASEPHALGCSEFTAFGLLGKHVLYLAHCPGQGVQQTLCPVPAVYKHSFECGSSIITIPCRACTDACTTDFQTDTRLPYSLPATCLLDEISRLDCIFSQGR